MGELEPVGLPVPLPLPLPTRIIPQPIVTDVHDINIQPQRQRVGTPHESIDPPTPTPTPTSATMRSPARDIRGGVGGVCDRGGEEEEVDELDDEENEEAGNGGMKVSSSAENLNLARSIPGQNNSQGVASSMNSERGHGSYFHRPTPTSEKHTPPPSASSIRRELKGEEEDVKPVVKVEMKSEMDLEMGALPPFSKRSESSLERAREMSPIMGSLTQSQSVSPVPSGCLLLGLRKRY